jgi:hypothetical protein
MMPNAEHGSTREKKSRYAANGCCRIQFVTVCSHMHSAMLSVCDDFLGSEREIFAVI